jgi:hypothetical protein
MQFHGVSQKGKSCPHRGFYFGEIDLMSGIIRRQLTQRFKVR